MLIENITSAAEKLYRNEVTFMDEPLLTNYPYAYELINVIDPNNIFLKIRDDENEQLQKELDAAIKSYSKDVPKDQVFHFPTHMIYNGMPVVVKRSKNKDGSWNIARGEIVTFENGEATVILVDEGGVERITIENILPITVNMVRLPRMGYRVRLSQIASVTGGAWPEAASDTKHYTGKSQVVILSDYYPQARQYEAIIQVDGIHVALKLFHLGLAKPEVLPSYKSNDEVFPLPNYSPWLGLKMISFSLRAFLDEVDKRIKCVLQINPEWNEQIQEEIGRCTEDVNFVQENQLQVVMPGMCCLAKYGGDEYFRAVVKRIVDSTQIQVEYVDYKELGMVPKADLLKCPQSLMEKPEAAVVCGITDFMINEFKDLETFQSMTKDKDVYVVIDACDPNLLGSELLVTLFEPVDFVSGADVPFRDILGLPNKPAELQEVIFPLFPVRQDVGSLILKTRYPPPEKFSAGVKTYVANVNSWDSVWIQMEADEALSDKLAFEMKSFYTSGGCDEDDQQKFVSNLKVGDYIATPVPEDEEEGFSWYRGKIVEMNSGKENEVVVHFLDWGYDDNVQLTDVYPLHLYFLRYPILIYEIAFKL